MLDQPVDDASTSNSLSTMVSSNDKIAEASNFIKGEIDYLNNFYSLVIEFFIQNSFKIAGAFIILLIGLLFASKLSKLVLKLCQRNNIDITLSRFIASATKMLIVILIVIIALGKLGVSLTPFIAAIGALSLGAGLALQGLLSNYAAGFNIVLTRPFVVGDTIKVHGVSGVVKEVLLAYTNLCDEDGVVITIPNKHIVGEVLHNSRHDSLLELSVGISYDHDPLEVIKLLAPIINKLDIVSEHKKPQIGIGEFADSAIVISIRLWTPTINFYASKYQANEVIYQSLTEANIKIPYPQRDLHIINTNNLAV
ncbi:mechanosensitive ion channel family protein [Colwelliaceae bacterium BS250]